MNTRNPRARTLQFEKGVAPNKLAPGAWTCTTELLEPRKRMKPTNAKHCKPMLPDEPESHFKRPRSSLEKEVFQLKTVTNLSSQILSSKLLTLSVTSSFPHASQGHEEVAAAVAQPLRGRRDFLPGPQRVMWLKGCCWGRRVRVLYC